MKILLLSVVFALVSIFSLAAAETYEPAWGQIMQSPDGSTVELKVATSMIQKAPLWDPLMQSLPLSPTQALAKVKAECAKLGAPLKSVEILTLTTGTRGGLRPFYKFQVTDNLGRELPFLVFLNGAVASPTISKK